MKPSREPVAIVGIGCRFPQTVTSADGLWTFLHGGGDASGEVPADRWDASAFFDPSGERPYSVYTKRGSFLQGHDLFDPEFFGYSPREAQMMDPQQRLLLETTWEAFEDAGHPPSRWAQRPVGVFVGLFTHDFEILRGRPTETATSNPYSATGSSATIAANRISHAFDFAGPSMVIDTACSSSLVAVHQACRSLLAGETELALAGGVNLQLVPETVVGLCKARMLAPDGRCKSFDARADGYARADGVGMVVLRRLADALRDGDRIYAVIHGSAVSQDGKTPTITMPDGDAQRRAIRYALAEAGLSPADISYVEAHGTGTPTGDPIEAQALGSVFGAAQPEGRSCVIGSIKSNIGHTESTAGVAGLIKVALMLQRGEILPNIHFETPNPNIPFGDLRLRVPTAPEPWDAPPQGRFAGVNSFGFGGTNAHVILGEGPTRLMALPAPEPDAPVLLCLSARSADSLRTQAARHAKTLRTNTPDELPISALAGALALEREHHPLRLAAAVTSRDAAIAALEAAATGEKAPGLVTGAAPVPGQLAFVFSGMGQQHWAMGRGLRRWSPAFARKLEEIDALFARHTDEWSLLTELDAAEGSSRIDRTDIAQPAIFALQVGLAAMWRALGVVPDVVTGHSVGEVAAAHVSGALTLEEAVAVSFHRSRLQARTAGQGRMLALGLSGDEAAERIAALGDKVCIAAVNSPRSVTLAGDAAVLARLEALFSAEGVFARMLNVEVPYHSPAMDAITGELQTALQGIRGRACTIPMISTVTGAPIDGSGIDAGYWLRNVREPVFFARAMESLMHQGVGTFLEVGAHPVLSAAMRECLSPGRQPALVLASQRRGNEDAAHFLETAGALFCHGHTLDFTTLFSRPAQPLHLPGYAWDHRRIWHESEVSAQQRLGRSTAGVAVHPLLGPREDAAGARWRGCVAPSLPDYLQDHRIRDAVLFPATGFIEMALAGAARAEGSVTGGEGGRAIGDFRIERPLVLDPKQRMHLQLAIDAEGSFAIHASPGENEPRHWTRHATGKLLPDEAVTAPVPAADPETIRARLSEQPTAFYEDLARKGLQYGPRFANLRGVWLGRDEALGQIVAGPEISGELCRYHVHPALLDSCLHALALFPGTGTYLPSGCGEVSLYGAAGGTFWVHLQVTARSEARIIADFNLFTTEGQPIARLRNFTFRLFEGAGDAAETGIARQFRQCWIAAPMQGHALSLPDPAALAGTIHARAALYAPLPADRLAGDVLEDLARALVVAALDTLGSDWRQGLQDPQTLAQTLGIAPQQVGLLGTLITALAGSDPSDLAPAATLFQEARATLPHCSAELAALWHVGMQLPTLLRSPERAAPLPSALAEPLVAGAASGQSGAQGIEAGVAALLAAMPPQADLRIVHLGAGNGSLLARLLPLFPPERCSLLAIDPPGVSADWLRSLSPAYPFLRRVTRDIAADPADDVLPEAAFDLAIIEPIAVSGKDLAAQIAQLHRALAPGGLLLTAGQRSDRPLWQLLIDALSPVPAAPDRAALLAGAGFEAPVALLMGKTDKLSRDLALVCRRAPAEVARPVAKAGGLVLMLDDGNALADTLDTLLRQQGVEPLRLKDADLSAEILIPLLATLPQGEAPVVLDLRATPRGPRASACPSDAGIAHCQRLSRAVLALIDAAGSRGLRYWLVTQDAQVVGPSTGGGLDQAPLWGFSRSLLNEEATLDLRLVDLSAEADSAEASSLAALILNPDAEDEIALRGTRRLVRRVVNDINLRKLDGSAGGFALHRRRRRPPADLFFAGATPAAPAPGEVQLRLCAVGLNFKDSAVVAGLLDDSPQVDTGHLGLEGAGVVVAVGEGVEGLKAGDAVFGLIGGIGFPASARPGTLLRKPADLPFSAVAGLPVAMCSAWHALKWLAKLEAGETVLIHSASSALGLAAIQVARHLGARVLATAGHDYKRSYLEGLGVEVIGTSRDASFAPAARAACCGTGVDVILSQLPASLMGANLDALRPTTGRLIDVTNIHYDVQMNLQALAQGITLSGFDLMRIVDLSPDHVAKLLAEIGPLLESGALAPLPYREIPVARGFEAMRGLMRGGHIGKNVINMCDGAMPVSPAPGRLALDPGGSYLISGGLSGLGLALAQRLGAAGARHLVLLGRRGAASPEAAPVLAALRHRGVTVEALACDVSDPAQVQAVVSRFGQDFAPLRGVIHAAGLLRDSAVRALTRDALEAVMQPKARGAWNLHQATLAHDPVFFVGITSFANIIGNLGQANYNAANEFVDALIAHRRARGLPGLSLALGVVADIGFVARDAALRANTQRLIAGEVSIDEIWDQLCRGLQDGLVQVGYSQADWQQTGRLLRSIRKSPRFAPVIADSRPDADPALQAARDAISPETTPEARRAWLAGTVKAEVARVLGLSSEQVNVTTPLVDHGFDSLISAELILALELAVGVTLRQGALLRADLTVATMVDELENLLGSAPVATGDTGTTQPAALPDTQGAGIRIEELSDSEVDALLKLIETEGATDG